MRPVFFCIVALLLTSCATKQTLLKSPLVPVDQSGIYLLQEELRIKARDAAPSILNAGTIWQQIGSIEQGIVYNTDDQVIIVNSFNVHEGYIVVKDAQVVGYYLPVEQTFVPVAPTPIKLSVTEK